MARLIILVAVILMAWLLWQNFSKVPSEQRPKLLLRSAFWVLLGIILLLVATGRAHWLTAAIAAMIPVMKGLFSLLLRALPALQLWLRNRQSQGNNHQAPLSNKDLTKEEAWQLLGLSPGASPEEITMAHKRLIQKLHPDRGGNDYLAAKLNAARDLLLEKTS